MGHRGRGQGTGDEELEQLVGKREMGHRGRGQGTGDEELEQFVRKR